ncbi:uncharacterized protein [Phaseolus vulgaris]|uniref:uncharacterized protein n=1 Tax=Phaseolus vulgaris TaxID=3885 RepID=UPI0035CAA473
MKIFVESIDRVIWDAIVNGSFVPKVEKDDVFIEKPWVLQSATTKEMWDILEVTHESTIDVQRARMHALIQEYEMFKMLKRETIFDVQKRFTHIVNQLISLGKIFEREKLNIKIIKCLDRSWQSKVTVISESKDLTTLITASWFGKLREHEHEMN